MQDYIERTSCRVCASKNIEEILDLNNQPLANSYHKGESQKTFPLKLNLCHECFHLQLSVVVNPSLMFEDYLYVSGTSKTLHKYFEDFVDICENVGEGNKKVLDIACNDGTQLDKFKERGWDTYGVDPAKNLHALSNKDHDVVCDYWTEEVAQNINNTFDVIVAQNVFAHVDDIHGFLKACLHVMDENGHLLIQTSQADMIINNEFDTIYHEHLSFFNTNSMKKCLNINGLSLVDVFKTDIHGGSYVFVAKKGEHNEDAATREIQKEKASGLYDLYTYNKYAQRCNSIVREFAEQVAAFKDKHYKVVGYGAAAKGNTFLNFGSVDLDYIVDDNSLKWGLQTPGRNIPIKDPTHLSGEKAGDLVIVPLAWNFFKEIKQKATQIAGPEIKFIKYFPEVRIL